MRANPTNNRAVTNNARRTAKQDGQRENRTFRLSYVPVAPGSREETTSCALRQEMSESVVKSRSSSTQVGTGAGTLLTQSNGGQHLPETVRKAGSVSAMTGGGENR